MALILALDGSASVDDREFELQQKGVAAALSSPEVVEAIMLHNGVQLMAFEWSGRYNQMVMQDWKRLENEADIATFALKLATHQRASKRMPTAIGYALGFAASQFTRVRQVCARLVIDVAGDGIQNDGFGPLDAYRNFNFSEVTVNGLVIKGDTPDPEDFYRKEVLHGPGAFLVVADDFEDYLRAMKEKLLKELGQRSVSMRR